VNRANIGAKQRSVSEMRRSGKGSGGGLGMNKNVRVGVRKGAGAKAINHAGAAQLGQRQGNHVTHQGATRYGGVDLYSDGPGYNKAQYGNEVAKNVGDGGPGKGYVQYGQSGSQGCHGTPAQGNPPPKGELFPGWPAKR
jgi:hypothetical protein